MIVILSMIRNIHLEEADIKVADLCSLRLLPREEEVILESLRPRTLLLKKTSEKDI